MGADTVQLGSTGCTAGRSSVRFLVLQYEFLVPRVTARTKQLPVAELSGSHLFFFANLIRLDLFLTLLITTRF